MITPNQFAALMLRVFALWLLFTAGQIGLLTYALDSNGRDNASVSYALATFYLTGALLLWTFPLAIAARILPQSSAPRDGAPRASEMGAVAFVSAGLLVIATKALTPVAHYVALVSMLLISGQAERLSVPSLHIDGLVGITMLAIGLLLIFKSRYLARRVLPTSV